MNPATPPSFHHPMHASRGAFLYYEWCIRAAQPGGVAEQLARTFCFRRANGPGHDCLRDIANTIHNTAQPQTQTKPSDLLVPMLLWSTRQPWANRINWQELRQNWISTFAVPGTGVVAHVDNAIAGVALTKDLFALFPILDDDLGTQHLLDFWLTSSREGLWRGVENAKLTGPGLTRLYSAWLDLFTVVKATSARDAVLPPDFSTPSVRNFKWNGLVIETMRQSSPSDQQHFMRTVFQSDFNAATKLSICRFVNAEQWMEPGMRKALLALMPPREEDRLPHLHWFGFHRAKGDAHIAAMNQELLASYCPSMLGLACAFATPEDWRSVTNMGNLAKALAVASAPHAPALALPIDCFDEHTRAF